jgi:methionyl-tRNA formyltransferase
MGRGRINLMKIIFFGTPEYVVPILAKLAKSHEIVAVVTQPPMPVGREQFKKYSPVDDWAHKRDVPIFFDFEKPFPEADLGICAAYGKIIPDKVIKSFHHGILVVHPSLLPQFRWGSPVQATIVTNTNPTGATVMKMDPHHFDHGPVITQFQEEILPDDTTGTLRARLFERSADVLVQLLPAYLAGKTKPKPQDDDKATFARMLTRDDAFIQPKYLKAVLEGKNIREKWEIPFIKDSKDEIYVTKASPETAERFIRAMNPWPSAWTKLENQKRLKLLKAHLEEGKLILDEVQLEGKDPVSWKQFKEGYPNSTL